MLHDPDAAERFGRTPYDEEMPSMDLPPKDDDGRFRPMPDDEKLAVATFLAAQGADAEEKPADYTQEQGDCINGCVRIHRHIDWILGKWLPHAQPVQKHYASP